MIRSYHEEHCVLTEYSDQSIRAYGHLQRNCTRWEFFRHGEREYSGLHGARDVRRPVHPRAGRFRHDLGRRERHSAVAESSLPQTEIEAPRTAVRVHCELQEVVDTNRIVEISTVK